MHTEFVPFFNTDYKDGITYLELSVPPNVVSSDFNKIILNTDFEVNSFRANSRLSSNPKMVSLINDQLKSLAYSLYVNSVNTEDRDNERTMFAIRMEGWFFEIWVREIYLDNGDLDVQLVLADMWGDSSMLAYDSKSYLCMMKTDQRVTYLESIVSLANEHGSNKFSTWNMIHNIKNLSFNHTSQIANNKIFAKVEDFSYGEMSAQLISPFVFCYDAPFKF